MCKNLFGIIGVITLKINTEMLQKINLINYLKIGISFIISLLFLTCGKNYYVWNAEMKVNFINETNKVSKNDIEAFMIRWKKKKNPSASYTKSDD